MTVAVGLKDPGNAKMPYSIKTWFDSQRPMNKGIGILAGGMGFYGISRYLVTTFLVVVDAGFIYVHQKWYVHTFLRDRSSW